MLASSRRRWLVIGICLATIIGMLLIHGFTPQAEAQKKFVPPPTAFECRWTDGPIKIDGAADEAAWKHAQTIDKFYLPWLGKDARLAKKDMAKSA